MNFIHYSSLIVWCSFCHHLSRHILSSAQMNCIQRAWLQMFLFMPCFSSFFVRVKNKSCLFCANIHNASLLVRRQFIWCHPSCDDHYYYFIIFPDFLEESSSLYDHSNPKHRIFIASLFFEAWFNRLFYDVLLEKILDIKYN